MNRFLFCLLLAIVGLPCVNGEKPQVDADVAENLNNQPVEVELPGVGNAHLAGNILLAGQPSQEALKNLASDGYKTVISLREKVEERFDEQAICESLGMQFIRLPINSPDDMSRELIGRACTIMKAADGDSGVVLHCASANRVGAIWLAHRVKVDGIPLQQAKQEAARVGLQTKVLEERAIEYLKTSP